MAQLLKAELIAARATAQALLLKDRHGRRCAERLCFVQDEIIRILYAAATRHLYHSPIPSGAERMAVVATGGYGRGLMAPESDIDLLFILPYKQTAWGEQVAEAILYCLWDMGLKVGHATRSVDESIRQARGDMTIRTALLEAAAHSAYDVIGLSVSVAARASEIAALCMEQGFDDLDAPVLRVTDEDVPLPYAANLERAAIIDAARVVAAVRKVCNR